MLIFTIIYVVNRAFIHREKGLERKRLGHIILVLKMPDGQMDRPPPEETELTLRPALT